MTPTKIILKSGKHESLQRQHPWVFSGAVKKTLGNPENGDLVDVYSNKDEFLGRGHYQKGSIMVRILSFDERTIDKAFFYEHIRQAMQMRRSLGLVDNQNTNVYRLFFAEGDGLPGLVIDIYNKTAVIQAHSIGIHRNRSHIANSIKELYNEKIDTIYYKSKDSLPAYMEDEKQDEFLLGNKEEDVVIENGISFKVNWVEGQKTGFFIDQRYNRSLVGKYAKGRNVLNTYCYTGGFSIYAQASGAKEVHSVDSSKRAIELTDRNVALNDFKVPHVSHTIDTMSFMDEIDDDKFDLIILDPPAFAKHKDVRHRAVQGYKRLNLSALRKIKSGGILFTFSCSQAIDQRIFESTITAAAIIAKRKIRILHHLSQPEDHPYSIYHPEGRYLKGLVLYVE
jgi:23S rRNA (cytosine1962-C5)-methyltransferase